MKPRVVILVLMVVLLAVIAVLMLLAGKSVSECEAHGGHISSVPPNKGRCVQ